jgi:hypothetical protein
VNLSYLGNAGAFSNQRYLLSIVWAMNQGSWEVIISRDYIIFSLADTRYMLKCLHCKALWASLVSGYTIPRLQDGVLSCRFTTTFFLAYPRSDTDGEVAAYKLHQPYECLLATGRCHWTFFHSRPGVGFIWKLTVFILVLIHARRRLVASYIWDCLLFYVDISLQLNLLLGYIQFAYCLLAVAKCIVTCVSVVGWEISSRIKVPLPFTTSYNDDDYYLVLCNLSPRGLSSTTFRL